MTTEETVFHQEVPRIPLGPNPIKSISFDSEAEAQGRYSVTLIIEKFGDPYTFNLTLTELNEMVDYLRTFHALAFELCNELCS